MSGFDRLRPYWTVKGGAVLLRIGPVGVFQPKERWSLEPQAAGLSPGTLAIFQHEGLMAMPPTPPATAVSRHFEVVDDEDRAVGGIKHATWRQAKDLHDALASAGNLGPFAVAEVIERRTIQREVRRFDGSSSCFRVED